MVVLSLESINTRKNTHRSIEFNLEFVLFVRTFHNEIETHKNLEKQLLTTMC